jgi:amino acid transporter
VIIGNDWSALGEIRREDITIDANDQADISGSVAIQWSLLLNTLFWNFNGFSNMSVFGGEVQNPGKTYPRALTISVVLVSLTYLIPLFGASVYNAPHWSTWEEGAFAQIAQSIGGPFLTGWIMFGTFGSNIGMFISYLLCNTFQIVGMSECGLAPTFLHRRSEKFGTPLNATLVCLAIILVLIMFEFEEILYIENALASSYQLLLLIAFLRLRYTHAELPRPVKVPGSAKVLMLVLLPTFGLYIWVVIDTFSSLSRAILIGSVMIVGFIYAKLKKFTREQFENLRMSQ